MIFLFWCVRLGSFLFFHKSHNFFLCHLFIAKKMVEVESLKGRNELSIQTISPLILEGKWEGRVLRNQKEPILSEDLLFLVVFLRRSGRLRMRVSDNGSGWDCGISLLHSYNTIYQTVKIWLNLSLSFYHIKNQ